MGKDVTGANLFATRDYMRCVCDSWGQSTDDCLVAVPDATDADEESGAAQLFLSSMAIAAATLTMF